jgi:regulatory protein
MDLAWLERKALDYTARWESTQRGVADFLERKIRWRCEETGERPEEILRLIPGVVEALAERNFVNDRRAAEQLFERLRREGRSEAQIRQRLASKGVPAAMADALLHDEDSDAELRAARRMARKRLLGPHCPDPERRIADRHKHLGVLARQGFSSDVAHRVIDSMDEGDETRIGDESDSAEPR